MSRFVLLLLCGLLGGSALARAGEGVPPSRRAAERVVRALAEGDRELIERLAQGTWPDPWLVAFRLCMAGRKEAAHALATASEHPSIEGLCDREDPWQKAPVSKEVLARLDRVEAAFTARDWKKVIALGREIDPGDCRFLQAVRDNFVGTSLVRDGQHEAAVAALQAAGRTADEIGWLRGAAGSRWTLADAQLQMRDYEGAFESWTRAAADYDRLRDEQYEALSRANVGSLSIEMGDYGSAVRQLPPAIEILKKLPRKQPGTVPMYLRNAALAWHRLGHFTRALADYREARRLSAADGDAAGAAAADMGLAMLHASLGDYDEGLRAGHRAVAGFRAANEPDGLARATGTLGSVHVKAGNLDLALQHYEDARRMLQELGAELEAARALEGKAIVLGLAGRRAEAIEQLEAAVAIFRRAKDLNHEIDGRYWIAEFRRREGKLEEAADRFKRLRMAADEFDVAAVLVDVNLGLAEVELARERHAAAMAAAKRAVEVMSLTYRGLGLEQGAMARAPRQRIFAVGIQAAASIRSAVEFSYFLESGRAGALLETLEAWEEIRDSVIPTRLREAEEAARRKVSVARRRLHELAEADANLDRLRQGRAKLREAQDQLRDAIQEIRRLAKAGADWLYMEPVHLDVIREGIRPDDAVLQFAFLEEKAYALVATRKDARLVHLGGTAEVEKATSRVAEALADKDADPHEALAALRKIILEPLGLGKHIRRLLVLPDGGLYWVPLRALAEEYETSYIPSGTTVERLRGKARAPGKGVLALGDPVYVREQEERGGAKSDGGGGKGEGAGRGGPDLPPLPATRAEVEAIGTRKLLGEGATEAALRDALKAHEGRWRSVHLACHGLIDPEHPMRSALAITPAQPDDGYLTAMEVLGMRIDTDLAVLSACDSGRGKVYRGEGLLGFTRAFMIAGAPRLLVSLWRVDDKATQALMLEFYKHWTPKAGEAGKRASQALKLAQEHVKKQKGWAHPYYWAGWVLWGLPD